MKNIKKILSLSLLAGTLSLGVACNGLTVAKNANSPTASLTAAVTAEAMDTDLTRERDQDRDQDPTMDPNREQDREQDDDQEQDRDRDQTHLTVTEKDTVTSSSTSASQETVRTTTRVNDDNDDDDDDDEDATQTTAREQVRTTTQTQQTQQSTTQQTVRETARVTTQQTNQTTAPAVTSQNRESNQTSSQAQQQSRLSAVAARQMVLNRFGSPSIIEKIEYTYDESNPLYKGEAVKNGYRVVFELNARTQAFVKWSVGNDNDWNKYAHQLQNMITLNQAAGEVVARSGQTNTFVQKIEFNWDDEKPLYQGEAFNNGVKYSFEIKAFTGEFQKFDASRGDETWAEKYQNVR